MQDAAPPSHLQMRQKRQVKDVFPIKAWEKVTKFISNLGSFQMEGFKGLPPGSVCCKAQEKLLS